MKYAYLSMISSDNFMLGALVLYQSLQSTKPKYPIYLLLSDKVSLKCEQNLINYGINIIRDSKPIIEDLSKLKGNNSRWNFTFDKIKILKLEQFDKIVFLDSDMYVLHNLDDLFKHPHFSAVPTRVPMPWLDNKIYFNSGLLVVKPSNDEFARVKNCIMPTIDDFRKISVSLGDQDVFHRYKIDWPEREELHLADGYNVFWGSFNYYIRKLNYTVSNNQKIEKNKIYVIHYTGPKPWMNKYLFILRSLLRPLKNEKMLPSKELIKMLILYYRAMKNVKKKLNLVRVDS